ncbi:uncharacterized protein METZ01_LOCUS168801, partial [marine metagenome]
MGAKNLFLRFKNRNVIRRSSLRN